MPVAKSIKSQPRRNPARPEKPYADYPVMPHASGRWAKKIRQALHDFGRWGRKQGDTIVPVEDTVAKRATRWEKGSGRCGSWGDGKRGDGVMA